LRRGPLSLAAQQRPDEQVRECGDQDDATHIQPEPGLIICGIRTRPVPKTMALGDMPTGIMNAQLAAIVAGSSSAGGTPIPARAR
jgi:hypothetical protein